MAKRLKFEVDGEQHELVMRPLRRALIMKMASLANPDDMSDWGIEAIVKSIDGEPIGDDGHELEWDAFPIATDFLTKKLSRIRS